MISSKKILLSRQMLAVESGYNNLIIVGLSLLIITIPILSGYQFNFRDEAQLTKAIVSHQAETSNIFFLCSTIPFMLDTVLDYYKLFDQSRRKRYVFGKIPIAIVGLLVGVQFIVISDTSSIFGITNSVAVSYIYTISCFRIVFTGSMMFVLTCASPAIFSGRMTSLFTLIVSTFIAMKMYTPGSNAAFQQFSIIINIIFFILIIGILFNWIYQLAKVIRCLTASDYTSVLMLFTFLVGLLGSYISVFESWGHHERGTAGIGQELAIINYCYTFMYVMLSIAPGRIARFEAVTHLVSCCCICIPLIVTGMLTSVYLYCTAKYH